MDVASIAAGATGPASTGKGRGMADMSSEDFFSLLIAELKFQDPFKPMDNAQMLEQLASIRDMEMSTNLSQALQSVTKQQNYATAASLIGKHVVGTITNSVGEEQVIDGIVTGVRFEGNGQIVLELDTGRQLPLEAVVHIGSPDEAAAAMDTGIDPAGSGQTDGQVAA